MAAAEAASVQDSWSALQGHSRRRKEIYLFRRRLHYTTVRQVQPTAYLLEFFSWKTYPPSERPVKHPSRSLRQYTFWNCLHLRWYWGPGNWCKPANVPLHRPQHLREVLQLTPTSLSLEPPMPPLDMDTAGHPNHALSTGALETIARFANAPYPWTTLYPHAGDFTPVPVRGMPQTQLFSTHAGPPQSADLGNASQLLLQIDAPDPHLTHGRYFEVRSAAAPPTATAFKLHPSLKGKRKRSFTDHQWSYQRHPEVLRQRFPRLFIGNPKQQHSTKRRLTPG